MNNDGLSTEERERSWALFAGRPAAYERGRTTLLRVLRERELALCRYGLHESVLIGMGLLGEEDRHPLTWRPAKYVGWKRLTEGSRDIEGEDA